MTGQDPHSGVQSDGAFVPAFRGQRPPFEPGNQAARRHGFHAQIAVSDRPELEEITDGFRELLGARWAPELEPLVVQAGAITWRLRRGYGDLAEHGLTRGSTGSAAPLLRHIEAAERALLEVLRALALTVPVAADVGLVLARKGVIEERFDLGRLSAEEQRQLEALLARAEVES